MNKIYKLIWSKVKNCWVVTSEMAKGHGKNKSRVQNSLLAAFVTAALLAGGVTDVQALTQQEKEEVAQYLLDKIAHGGEIPGAKAEYGPTNFPDAIANRIFYSNDISNKIGEKLKNDGLTLRYFGVRPDYREPSRDYLERYAKFDSKNANNTWTNVNNDGAFGAHSMALGYRAFSEAKHGVAIGRSALAGGSKRGENDYGGDGGVAIGNTAWALGDKAVSIGNDARAVHKGIAIGIQAEAGLDEDDNTTDWSTAPGFTPKQGKSIQYDPKTKLPYVTSDLRDKMGAIAIGIDAKAHGNHSTAMGVGAKAKSRYAWSFGYSSEASGVGSIAFGSRATAKGTSAIAIGSGNYDQPNGGAQAYSEDTIAIGRGAKAGNENDTTTKYNSIAIGPDAQAYSGSSEKVQNSTALGAGAYASKSGVTAVGASAVSVSANSTVVGYKAVAASDNSVVLGANTRSDIDGGVALGSESNVGSYADSSYGKAGKVGYDPLGTDADGTSTWKATKAAVSVGNQQKDITRQIINVAAGTDNTDAVNVAQLKTLGRKAWKDLAAAKDELGARIATNTTSITALSGKVRTNTQDIGRLKTDVSTNDTRIRYLYDNMPFMHYVSVKSNGSAPNEGNYKNDGAKAEAAIAIGAHTASDGDSAVALGAHSFARGQDSVIVGAASYNSTGAKPVKEGQFDQSIILGSNNTIFAQSAENGGREDKIIGNMNRVEESYGTFVRGTGNMVYDAYNEKALLTDEDKQKEQDFLDPIDGGDPTGLFQKGRSHVTVEGDGNLVGGALYTQVSGVGNEVSNSQPDENSPSTPRVTYNIVTGNRNTVIDSSHNLIMGDNHELEKVNGNIIIGSQKAEKTKTEASNVTILGNDANVSVEGGVALGTGSVASTAAEVAGYDPLTGEASTKTTATWKSGNGAVSVGTTDKTRQITNLAAGTADTDAVNVAQLKNSKTAVEAGDYVTVTKKTEDGKGTTYTVKGPSLTSVDTNLTVTDDKDANDKKVGYKLQLSKTLKGLTSVSSDEFKVGDKTYINKDGINANNNKITNVAAGAADGDAVNFKQLNDVSTQVTTNKNAIDGLTPKVANNTTNIGKLQAGFTVKDGGEGKADVTLGGDTKQEVTFKAAVDKTTQATENGSSLTSAVDADRNVTYSLNMNQLKKDLGITDGPDGVMSSWKLKVKDETTPKEIKNGNTVTFEADGDGLTVARTDSTIKYTIDGSKLNIAQNQSITNLGKRIDNLDPIHYFSVNSTDKDAGSNYKNDGAKKDGSIAIGPSALNNGTQSVAVGLKSKVEDGWYSVALGTESKTNGHFTTAIGYQASATKLQALALGTNAEAAAESGISIGVKAKSLANRGIAVGTNSTVDQTGGRGIAIGDGAYVGAKTQGHLGTGMPNPGDAWNPSEPYLPVADDTVAGPGKLARENSMAIGMKASAFGFQTTALGAAAEAHDTNTTAVGAAAVAKGNYSTALGKQARTFDKESTSVGHWADSRAEFATALGSNTIVYKKGGVALGFGARAYDENSIAIGSNSFAKEAIDGKAYLSDEEVKAAAGIVSVGNPAYKVGDKDFAANYRRIVNVAGGIHDNDAVNVAQLKALEGKVTGNAGDITTLKEGWTLQDANKTVGTKTVKAKDTVTVTGDDYINATVNNDGLTLGMDETKLNKQINSQIDDSATVKAKMNSWVLKATSDKDAEKAGKTINNDNNAVTFDATGAGLTVTRDGSTITYGIDGKQIDISENETVAGLETEIKESKTTVEAAENSQITVTPKKQDDKSTKYVVDIAKDGTIGGTNDGNLVTGKTVKDYVDANKVTVTGDENGSGVKVENIAEDGKPANYKVSLGDKIKAGDVTVDGTKGAGQITGLSNTTWDAGNIVSGRAATEDQLKAVSQNAAEAAKKHTTVVAGDYVTVSEGTNDNGGKEYTVNGPKVAVAKDEKNLVVGDIMDGDKKVGYELKLNKELTGLTSVSSDTFKSGEDVTINNEGLTIKDGPSVTTKGIDAGKKKITNVADGDVSENSTDAVNGGQLYKLQQTVAGNKVTVEAAADSQITVKSEKQNDQSTKYVVDIKKDGTIGGDKDGNLVTGKTVKDYVDANKVTVTGDEDGSGVKVETIVEKGKPTNYKVSLGDKIKAGDVTVDGTEGKGQIKGLSNTTWDADNIVSGRAATEDQLKEVSKNAAAEAAKKQTTLVAGDYVTVSEGTNTAGGKEYTVTGPKLAVVDGEENLVVGDITEGNKKVGYNLKLNKELKGLTSVSSDTFKSGDKVTINNEGLTIKDGPSVTTKGIDAGGKTIANVADGKADTDAVNVRQLNAIASQGNQNIAILGGKVSELDGRVNRVGAGAAALAALHPLDFDPDDKWDFAAGYGNYSGANAVAIGAYYRPNEDTMFSVGGSFGGGENMVNAGVSVKLGQGNNVTTSKIAMAKEIKDLRAEVEVLRQAIVGVGQGQELDPMKMKLFPDIEKNHWAYEAVEELAKQGLLEGYPDGTFSGDRMMTRYEFAEVVYRAMQKGLKVNEKLIQEFEPELERFRIDVISKDKDGNPVIERVRVNDKKDVAETANA